MASPGLSTPTSAATGGDDGGGGGEGGKEKKEGIGANTSPSPSPSQSSNKRLEARSEDCLRVLEDSIGDSQGRGKNFAEFSVGKGEVESAINRARVGKSSRMSELSKGIYLKEKSLEEFGKANLHETCIMAGCSLNCI